MLGAVARGRQFPSSFKSPVYQHNSKLLGECLLRCQSLAPTSSLECHRPRCSPSAFSVRAHPVVAQEGMFLALLV